METSHYFKVWGALSMKPVWRTHGCSLRKSIRAGWDRFVSHVRFEVGNGERVRSWYVVWDQSLKQLYLILFSLAANLDTLMSSYLKCTEGMEKHWVRFIKQFNEWEPIESTIECSSLFPRVQDHLNNTLKNKYFNIMTESSMPSKMWLFPSLHITHIRQCGNIFQAKRLPRLATQISHLDSTFISRSGYI